MKKVLQYGSLVLLGFILSAGIAYASAIKTWSSGETIRAADLNSNFAHIHNNMVGGGHNLLTNADVSASAGIAHTKLATPALLPKAWAAMLTACNAPGACTIAAGSGISAITRTGSTGVYTVDFSGRTDTSFGVLVQANTNSTTCAAQITSITRVTVYCTDLAAPTAADTLFTVLLLDNNN